MIIGITGPSGIGKTTLMENAAKIVKAKLKEDGSKLKVKTVPSLVSKVADEFAITTDNQGYHFTNFDEMIEFHHTVLTDYECLLFNNKADILITDRTPLDFYCYVKQYSKFFWDKDKRVIEEFKQDCTKEARKYNMIIMPLVVPDKIAEGYESKPNRPKFKKSEHIKFYKNAMGLVVEGGLDLTVISDKYQYQYRDDYLARIICDRNITVL